MVSLARFHIQAGLQAGLYNWMGPQPLLYGEVSAGCAPKLGKAVSCALLVGGVAGPDPWSGKVLTQPWIWIGLEAVLCGHVGQCPGFLVKWVFRQCSTFGWVHWLSSQPGYGHRLCSAIGQDHRMDSTAGWDSRMGSTARKWCNLCSRLPSFPGKAGPEDTLKIWGGILTWFPLKEGLRIASVTA